MKKIISLFLLFGFVSAMAEDCSQYIGTCSFYLCREKQHACGNKGYYLGFAYKYCRKAELELNKKLSSEGLNWSKQVAVCLQNSVDKIPDDDNCTDVSQMAIKEHAECYVDTGFCELKGSDKRKVLWLVKAEARHPKILKQGLSILNECREY